VNPVRFATKASDRGAGSRAEILARVRANQPPNVPLPPPRVYASVVQTHFETFAANLERMGGELIVLADEADLDDWIRRRYPDAEVVCSATPEVLGTKAIASVREPAELDDVDVGVVRAAFGVAETGSVLLTEQHLRINALGFLAQHLVVLLDPSAILPDLHHAYRDPSFTYARYTVLLTGPSATADIEGILVRGAQGARSLAVVARRKQEP
jgi:L-lactate dehydrogenase complex protein LldG